MPKRSKNVERLAGAGGAAVAAPWVFVGVLRLIDWIGRAQTTMVITPHLGVFATPQAFVIELAGAVGLLFYATRLEHYREGEEAPRVILAYSPPGLKKAKRHWLWLKVAIGVCAISCLTAVCVFLYVRRYSVPPLTALTKPSVRSTPLLTNIPIETRSSTHTPGTITRKPTSNKPSATSARTRQREAPTSTPQTNMPPPVAPLSARDHRAVFMYQEWCLREQNSQHT